MAHFQIAVLRSQFIAQLLVMLIDILEYLIVDRQSLHDVILKNIRKPCRILNILQTFLRNISRRGMSRKKKHGKELTQIFGYQNHHLQQLL